MSDKYKNIIQFPEHKTHGRKKQLKLEDKRTAIISSIIGVFVLATLFNVSIVFNSDERNNINERRLASISGEQVSNPELLKKLQETAIQFSWGKKPSKDDNFLYETLKGSYRLVYGHGKKVKAIELLKGADAQAITLNNPEKFIQSHKSRWGVKFDKMKLAEATNTQMRYKVYDEGNFERGQIELYLNDKGQLMTAKFQKF